MATKRVLVSSSDLERLRSAMGEVRRWGSPADVQALSQLRRELDRARVVEPWNLPPDVVRLGSRVRFHDVDTGEEMIYTLVVPEESNLDKKCLSVMAPLGMAIFGYRAGDVVVWRVPAGQRRLRIDEVLCQTESAG